jgi:lipid-binding SYLF domain-containing protein
MNHGHLGRCCSAALMVLLAAGCHRGASSAAETRSEDREHAVAELNDATVVVREMLKSDEIPMRRREEARCVVVVPSLVSGGLVIGARRGSGVVACRTSGAGWSGPACVTVTGGSAGLQAGIQSADVVMLVMSERGMEQLFRSSFELGADASAAAGPVGRDVQASTDEKMTAEILSYARSRGLFAGVQLSGAVMKQDAARVFALYGGSADVHAILSGNVSAPIEASAFSDEVRKAFPPKGAGDSAVTAPQAR